MSESKNNSSFREKLGRFVSPLLNSSTKDQKGDGGDASNPKNNSSVNLSRVISLSNFKRDNYTPSLKRPYSSIKQLNLPSSASKLSETFNNSKRQRTSEDSFGLFNISGDLQRPSSRLSLSSLSSAYTGASDFRGYRNLFSRTSSPQSIPNSTTSELNFASKQKNSSFYQAKTSFGGANVQQLSRRLSCTPYSAKNVNFVNVNSRTNDTIDKLDSNSINLLSLSSKTKKILDKLERASTPLSVHAVQDSAHPYCRPASSLSTPYPLAKSNNRQSKLTDTVQPSVLNNGRLNVDTSYKTKKFVLTAIDDEDQTDLVDEKKSSAKLTTTITKVNNSFDKDIEKLSEIINAEKELEKKVETQIIPRKDITFGKISQRDFKKGRKLSNSEPTEAEEIEHLNNLASVKPLGLNAGASLKTLKFSFGVNKQNETEPANEISSPACLTSATSLKTSNDVSSFKFSSPLTISSTISTKSTSLFNANFSTPVLAEAKTVKNFMSKEIVSNSTSVILKEKQNILGVFDSTRKLEKGAVTNAEANPIVKNAIDTSISKPISVETILKKKSAQLWTCPTCCVDNEPDLERCAACEEPNSNKLSSVSGQVNKPATTQFNFGSFGNVYTTSKPLNEFFKKESKLGGWKCSVCDVDNEETYEKCVSCEEPNPAKKKNTDETAKTNANISVGKGFVFGVVNKPVATANVEPPPTTINNLLIKKKAIADWTCPVCMVDNEPEASKCVSCEEPNPSCLKNTDNKNMTATKQAVTFKFGNFSNPTASSASAPVSVNKVTNIVEENKTSAGDGWKCFYCKATNNSLAKTCFDCDKIKTPAVTKNEMVKFCNSQSYKFGSNKPTVNSSEKISDPTKTLDKAPMFSFGKPTTTTEEPKPFTTPPVPSSSAAVVSSIPKMNAKPLSASPSPFTLEKLTKTSDPEKQSLTVDNKVTPAASIGSTFMPSNKEVTNVPDITEKEKSSPLINLKFDPITTKSSFVFDASKISAIKPSSLGSALSQPFVFGSSATTTLTTTSTVTLINSGSTITGSNLFGNNKVLSTTGSSLPSLPKLNSIAAPSTSSSVPLTTTFTFGASGTSKPTENQVSTNLFQFGTPKEPEKKLFATNLQVPAATTASLAIPSTFSFGPPKPSASSSLSASAASLFTFGSSAAPAAPTPIVPQASVPSTTASLGSTNMFNFGSPLNTPKLNAGEPLKLPMNFGQTPKATTLSTAENTSSALGFNFGQSSSSLVPSISVGKNLGEVNKISIIMPPAASSTSATPATNSLFGNMNATQAGQASAPSLGNAMFSFGANPASNNSQSNLPGIASSNLFSFGSAASNINQQQSAAPSATAAAPQTTGNTFNFFGSGEQKNPPMTFGANLFSGTSGIAAQPQPPTFGMPFTQTLKVNPPVGPNSTCQLPGATAASNNNQFAVNPFQFNSAAAATADSSNNSRIIKKARRRLK